MASNRLLSNLSSWKHEKYENFHFLPIFKVYGRERAKLWKKTIIIRSIISHYLQYNMHSHLIKTGCILARYFIIQHVNVITYTQILTFRLSHPFKMPSSNALIWLPLRSSILNCAKPWNSIEENTGFNASPNKLSANLNSSKVFFNPENIFSVSLLNRLLEKSIFFNSKPEIFIFL